MYFKDTIYYLYKKHKRVTLMEGARLLAEKTGKSRFHYICDMVWCSLHYGAMFTEYRDLDFAFRTAQNRATFLTTFYNFRLYDKINSKEKRDDFHNKIRFLNRFFSVIHRDWLDLNQASDDDLEAFLRKHQGLVLKASYGDSGKQVQVKTFSEQPTATEFRRYAQDHGFDLVEEKLSNHPTIAVLNETSLNTVRIVTLYKDGQTRFLFSGIRVGRNGALLDNISQGGAVARVDLETGEINTPFYTKPTSYTQEFAHPDDAVGVALPYWQELKALAAKASAIVPEMGFVAWDICITEHGPEIVEGNESFGSSILQLFSGHNDPGIKPQLLEFLKELNF